MPALAAAGVGNLAWDCTNTRRQADLDELTSAAVWDDRACADLFVDLLGIGFAYREHAEVLRAVWAHNHGQPAQAGSPVRMVALGLATYVEDPDLLDGRSAAELELRNWWMGGHYRDVAAFHGANVLATEVLRRGERAVVYADVDLTTTRLVQWHDGLATTTTGNLLHRWMGDGVRRVVFHGVVDDPAATARVEALVEASPESGRSGAAVRFGLGLSGSTLGNVGLTKVVGSVDGSAGSLRLRDVADGYLYLEARAQWQPVSLLDDLLTDENLPAAEARLRALVPRAEPYTADELERIRTEGVEQLTAQWPALPEPDPEPAGRRFGLRARRKPAGAGESA
ncbi:MAG TPA: hypothetical protein DEP69_06740 [Acidimicrobiaceae bacterium]|nr:hypothetical protein [Acidimicrobiaceae bacterium]